MNQSTNLIQYKNLSKEQQDAHDFEGYNYSYQNVNNEWNGVAHHEKRYSDFVYRLIIQPEKFYCYKDSNESGVIKGDKILLVCNSHLRNELSDFTILRPATEAEIPKPEIPKERGMMFKLGIQWKGGKFYKMHLDDVEIDPKDLLSHIDNLAGIRS